MIKFYQIVVSIFFLVIASTSNATPPSAYDFLKPSTNLGLTLSPDGQRFAFVKTDNKKYCIDRYGKMVKGKKAKCKEKDQVFRTTHSVLIYDLNSSKLIKNMPLGENGYISWLEWASDDRLLVAVRVPTTVGKGRRGYVLGGSRVLSVLIAPGEDQNTHSFTVLFGEESKLQKQNRYLSRVTSILRDDASHILMPAVRSGELDLWKVNIETGKADRIAIGQSGTFYWYADRAGNPVLRFDCRGRGCRKIEVYSPPNDGSEKWRKVRTFKVKPDDKQDDYDFWPIAPTDNPDQFYVFSDEDEDDRRSIKLYDVKTEETIKTVFQHPRVDVSGAVLDVQTGDYLGAYYYEDRLNYEVEDPTFRKHYKGMNKYFGDKANVSVIGYSKDQNKAIIFATDTNSPGGYYIYDFNAAHIVQLIDKEPELQVRLNGQSDILKIPTRDGSTITAYHTYPKGKKLSDSPLLVMPHGGPEQRDYYDYDLTVQYFVSRGYQTLQMNFRGSSGYGKKFAESGYGEWGGLMQNDLTDAVKYLQGRGTAKPEKTCMVGYSYGGYAALFAGATTPELYKCIVAGGGVSDLLLSLDNTRRDYGKDSESYAYWLKSIGNPSVEKEKLKSRSPVNLAAKFTAPVLLIHGEDDGVVYAEHSRKMKKALQKAGKSVELHILEDEGHSGWDLEDNIFYHETIESFLNKHLSK